MKARVYKTTTEFDARRLRITGTRYLCVETPKGKMHLMNYEYREYDDTADIEKDDYARERDDLWDHLGSCDGTCEETYDFPEDGYDIILEMAKANAEFGCSRYPADDE